MDLTLEEVFKLSLFSLKLSQGHPSIRRDLKWFLLVFVSHGIYLMYFALFLSNLIFYDLKDNDFLQSCKDGTVCVLCFSVSFQYYILICKKIHIKNLFEKIKYDYAKVKTQTADEQQIVLRYAKQSMRVGKMWFIVGVGGTMIFPLKNMLTHIYYYCIGEFRMIHLYDLVYPKVINDRKNQTAMFFIINVSMVLVSGYGSTVFSAFCPLGPNFLLHACGQLEILTKRVEKLFSDNHSSRDILQELKSISMELQRIYYFVNDIQQAFKIAFELILKVSSVVLPLTIYAIMESFFNGELILEFIMYTFGAIIISGSPCYYSELLMEKSEMFRLAIYSCGWEETWDHRARTMILLLLQRASRPIAIHTIFKTLCLDTLTDVYRQSYGLFNLINAVWN